MAAVRACKLEIYQAICKTTTAAGLNPDRRWAIYREALEAGLSGTITKAETDQTVLTCLGTQSIHLHNKLIISLLQEAASPTDSEQQQAPSAEPL